MWQWHRQLKVFHLNLNFVQWFGTIQGSKGIDLTLRETVMLLMSRISPPLPKTWPVHHVCQTSAVGGQLLCTPYYHHHCVTCYVTCYVTLPSLWQCTSYLHRDNVPSPDVHPTITMTMYILPSPWQCTSAKDTPRYLPIAAVIRWSAWWKTSMLEERMPLLPLPVMNLVNQTSVLPRTLQFQVN